MLELISIKIENLGSIEKQEFVFQDNLTTLIGINKDTSNIDKSLSIEEILKLSPFVIKSNGSGKTTIIEALHICLLGSCIKEKINLRELIRKNENKMRIELICKNTQIGLQKIRIIREIFLDKNKTSNISIYEQKINEEEKEIPKTTSEGMDKYILNTYIGLSKEDIDNFFIIQKEKFKSFLILPDSKKKEILSRLTGVSSFKFIEDNLKEEINNLNNQVSIIDKEIAKLEGSESSYKSILKDLPDENLFLKQKQVKVDNRKNSINVKENLIKKYKNNIQNNEKEKLNETFILNIWEGRKIKYKKYLQKNNLNEQINNLSKEKEEIEKEIEEIKEILKTAESLKKDSTKDLDKIEIFIDKLKILQKNLIECPKCKYKFNPKDNSSEKDIISKIDKEKVKEKDIKRKLSEVESDIKEIETILKEKNDCLEIKKLKIKKLKNKKERIFNIGIYIDKRIKEKKDDISTFENKIKNLKIDIKNFEFDIQNFKKEIELINCESFDSIKNDKEKYTKEIQNIQKEKEIKEQKKNELQEEIQLSNDSSLNFLLFKNYLFNKIIFEIEYIVNNYLSNFSDLYIKIKGSKTLADGKTTREEINCIITKKDSEISYFLLSSGEKAFVDIAFILAFQKILNITSNNGFNFLVLDEITGNVDCSNQEDILKTIGSLNKPILFVTHIPVVSDFKIVYIVKENNKSIILQ